MAEGLPINSKVLEWARQRAGLSLDQLEAKFPKFPRWELGEEQPSYAQLEQLAAKLHLPIVAFFFPDLPQVPPIRESFRTLPDLDFDMIPPQVRQMLNKAKALQLNLAELTGGQNHSAKFIIRDLKVSDEATAEAMAEQVRTYIGVSLKEQASWPDADYALKEWRKAIYNIGVFVFKDAFHSESYCGFSLYDKKLPVIYVNNSMAKTRQIFTLFHELAHIVFRTSGIDTAADQDFASLDARSKRIEVLCNRFASSFLVPEQAFAAEMRGVSPSPQMAERLARLFNVSREVIYRRYLDRSWIGQAEYLRAKDDWNNQKSGGGGSGGNHYYTKLAYLGREYVGLVLSQYQQNRIDDAQLASYLDTKPRNLASLEEYYLAGGQ